jgi:hypothetical protein
MVGEDPSRMVGHLAFTGVAKPSLVGLGGLIEDRSQIARKFTRRAKTRIPVRFGRNRMTVHPHISVRLVPVLVPQEAEIESIGVEFSPRERIVLSSQVKFGILSRRGITNSHAPRNTSACQQVLAL